MRQRKIKNEEEKLSALEAHAVELPKEQKGKWRQYFGNDHPIYIEIGCGKGKFIMSLAHSYPDRNFIAVEGQGSIILRALEKAKESGLPNIAFMKEYIRDIGDYFSPGELDGVYLNFSDPWPKDRHAKRRLTHGNYLEGYKVALKACSTIEFKTDNAELFAFAIDEFTNSGLKITELTEDLHNSSYPARDHTTEYEEKFRKEGKNINYLKAVI